MEPQNETRRETRPADAARRPATSAVDEEKADYAVMAVVFARGGIPL